MMAAVNSYIDDAGTGFKIRASISAPTGIKQFQELTDNVY
jgi:hypothetical protein